MRFVAWVLLGVVLNFSNFGIGSSLADQLARTDNKDSEEAEDREPERVVYPPIRHYRLPEGEPLKITINVDQALSTQFGASWKKSLDLKSKVERAQQSTEIELEKRYASAPNDKVMPCVEDRTIKHKFNTTSSFTAGENLTDYLIITRDDLPDNPIERFGERVMLFIYDFDDPKSAVRDIARGLGVECVPFRIRGSAKEVTRYYGRDALRKFEPTPSRNERPRRNQ